MRRALVGPTLTAIALLAMAQPASAASSPGTAGATTHVVTTSTDRSGQAGWGTPLVSTSTGFKNYTWYVDFDVSSPPDTRVVNVQSCVNSYDADMNLTKQRCTNGQAQSGITYTLDAASLTRASVSASGIPTQTCTTDANGQPIGQCTTGTPISVKATWTGQGPISYETVTQYIPNKYWYKSRSKSRGADAAATFNGSPLGGQLGFAFVQASTTKEWGSPCSKAASPSHPTHGTPAVPDGC
jgi:hypothetical protein